MKLLTQLFGDRAIIANATGCSSIYGGNLPTTPYAVNADGRGPAWSNSLFEDNAEFGFGFRLTIDKHNEYATELLHRLAGEDRRRPGAGAADGGPDDRGGDHAAAGAGGGPAQRSSQGPGRLGGEPPRTRSPTTW